MIILAAIVSFNCSKENPPKNYVAKVNNSYLTGKELSDILKSTGKKKYRNEVIRNWVTNQVLYQEAEKQGITDKDEFKKIINESRLELAGSMLIQRLYNKEKINYDTLDVQSYFEDHKNEFKLLGNSYYLNLVEFGTEDKAVQFRTLALENGWKAALEYFENEPSMIKNNYQSLFEEQEIYPVSLLRVIKELYPKEISIVIAEETGDYAVVQLINNFIKGTVPPFEAVRARVLKRFIEKRKEDMMNNYLQSLIDKYEIEIKN